MPVVDWQVTVSAPLGYPVQVVEGGLILADDDVAVLPVGMVVETGWGRPGPMELDVSGGRAIPVHLVLTWFSFAENRFFTVDAALPSAALSGALTERITLERRGEIEAFDRFIVGMAPGGLVHIWAAGVGGRRLLAAVDGSPTERPWSALTPSAEDERDAFVAEVVGRSRSRVADPLPLPANGEKSAWARAAATVPVAISVIGAGGPSPVTIDFLNGERARFEVVDDDAMTVGRRGAPDRLAVELVEGGPAGSLIIDVDPLESLGAMELIGAQLGSEPLILLIDLTLGVGATRVSFRNAERVYDLRRVETTVYARRPARSPQP